MKTSVAVACFALGLLLAGQAQNLQPSVTEVNMSSHDMHEMPGMSDDGSAHAMHAMEDHAMDMGPHMRMTPMRDPQPGDQAKADQVVQAARKVAAKYQDYKAALADGFKIFLPELPQKQYHFTNYWYGFETRRHFNPEHPTSLLYEKHGEGYKLIGVMYTAPKATRGRVEFPHPVECGAVARTREHVHSSRGQEKRNVGSAGPLRVTGFDHQQGRVRCRRRPFYAAGVRLDGARLSV
jgi:hypothetical protein